MISDTIRSVRLCKVTVRSPKRYDSRCTKHTAVKADRCFITEEAVSGRLWIDAYAAMHDSSIGKLDRI